MKTQTASKFTQKLSAGTGQEKTTVKYEDEAQTTTTPGDKKAISPVGTSFIGFSFRTKLTGSVVYRPNMLL